MSDGYIQQAVSAGGTSPQTATLNSVAAGSRLIAFCWSGNGAVTPTGFADGQGTYTAVGSSFGPNSDNCWFQAYELKNANSGTHAFQWTWSGGSSGIVWLVEVAADATTSSTMNAGQQNNPGSGEVLSSGTVTVAGVCTLLEQLVDTTNTTASNAPTVGTGFTAQGGQTADGIIGARQFGSKSISSSSAATGSPATGTGSTDGFFTIGIAVPNAGASTAIDQEGSRFGNDDGNEAAHTFAAAENASIYAALGANLLLRLLLNGTGDPASSAFKLRYQKNGSGGYVDVPVGSTTAGSPTNTSAKFPTSGTTQDRSGATAWTNPGNITVDDTSDATAAVPTDYLIATAFDFSEIPDNSTINGVTVKVNASETGTGSSNYVPQLCSAATPTLIGSAKTAVTVSGTTKVESTNGGTADTWGASLTAAIVKSSGFGVVIWSTDTVNTLAIDYITISINYTPPGSANEVYVATSANIAAGGEATTARLTAPSGKTTSDFVTGRRWDDENGSDAIDITVDDYTEVEWCLQAQSPAANGDYFDFRVYVGATPLDTYSVTPRWTIGTPPSDPPQNLIQPARAARQAVLQRSF